MPRLYDYRELNELPANSPGIAGMAQAARNAVCGAYHKYPGAFQHVIADSPAAQLQQALWDKVCPVPQRPPTMPVPAPLPAGGQCPIRYRVDGTWSVPNNPNVPPVNNFSVIAQGPIQGIVQTSQPGSISFLVQGTAGAGGGNGRVGIFTTASGPSARDATAVITSITPIDSIPPGGCNTLPSPRNYPPVLPDLNSFVLPPAPSPVPGPLAPPNPPTIVRPSPRLPRLPLPLPFGPFVQVDVGPFNFEFNLGGIEFNLKPDVDVTFAPNVDINIQLPPGGSSGGGGTTIELPEDCGCSDQFTRLREQVDSLRPRFTSATTEQLAANSTGGNATLPSGHIAIQFVITDRPVNSNEMSGSGGPDVFYPGWFAFGRALGQGGVRTPIDYLAQFIFTPVEATTVCWTVKRGYRVNVFVVRRIPPLTGTWARGEQLYFQV